MVNSKDLKRCRIPTWSLPGGHTADIDAVNRGRWRPFTLGPKAWWSSCSNLAQAEDCDENDAEDRLDGAQLLVEADALQEECRTSAQLARQKGYGNIDQALPAVLRCQAKIAWTCICRVCAQPRRDGRWPFEKKTKKNRCLWRFRAGWSVS